MEKDPERKMFYLNKFDGEYIIVPDFEDASGYNRQNILKAKKFIRLLAYSPNYNSSDMEEIVYALEILLDALYDSPLNKAPSINHSIGHDLRDYMISCGWKKSRYTRCITIIQMFFYWAKQQYPKQLSAITDSWIHTLDLFPFLNHEFETNETNTCDKNFFNSDYP